MQEPGGEFLLGPVVTAGPTSSSDGSPVENVLIYCQRLDFVGFARGNVHGVRVVTPVTYAAPLQRPAHARYHDGVDRPAQLDEASPEVWALRTDQRGYIAECTRANFMFARHGRIKLPDRSKVLPEIRIETIVELAESLGIAVDEGDYNTHDVYLADEAFVSGTRYCLLPVT